MVLAAIDESHLSSPASLRSDVHIHDDKQKGVTLTNVHYSSKQG